MAVYVLRTITGMTEACHQLTDQQRKDLMKKRGDLLATAGGKVVGAYRSYAGGQTIYIISYPSLEVAEKDRMAVWSREGLNFSRYWPSETDILYELPPNS